MRALLLLGLLFYLIPSLLALVAQVPTAERQEYGALVARETTPTTTTATETSVEVSTRSETATSTGESNSTSTTISAASSTTTIASLNTSLPSKEDELNSTAPGTLPIEPVITPSLGISGFILIVTGAILALIGIRNLWVQVFLSSAFLTSLGVTVLIVYVMNPPVRVAVQGAYLVAVVFTGITFGALSIVFKELTEGLGCLLGGFCTSMWLLSTRPGGLLTETDAKAGFIGAISVAFYALSFSHYTRPYGLIGSTAIAGGTAVALGIDCYSRAGLKEFWLYIWALNVDIFPLDTNTYPVTRNIRVELAATVIIAIMGVVSQLRLWKVVRERRQKEEEKRLEEERKKEEAEAEVVKRLEENNLKERMEWEAKYGEPSTSSSSPSIPELPDESRKCAADEADAMEKGEALEIESIQSSGSSYRCTQCREMEDTDDSDSDITDAADSSETKHPDDTVKKQAKKKHEKQVPGVVSGVCPQIFDGAAAVKIEDDSMSDVTAIIGSDAVSVRSQEFTIPVRKVSQKAPEKTVLESREALLPGNDDASSTQGIVDEEISDVDSDCRTIAAESNYQAISKIKAPTENEDHTPGDHKVSQPQVESKEGDKPSNFITPIEVAKQHAASLPGESPEFQKTVNPTVKHEQKALPEEKLESKQAVITKPASQPSEAKQDARPESADQPVAFKDTPKDKEVVKDSELPVENVQDDFPPSQEEKNIQTEAQEKESPAQISTKVDQKCKPEDKTKSGKDAHTENNPTTGKSSPEKQDTVSSEEASESNKSSKPKKDRAISRKEKSSGTAPKAQAKRKKEEPAKLDAETVKHISKQTSRVVLSYRTNEWAKHLADAETPWMEPIKPFEEDQPESAVDTEEAVAPVRVTELLQTPLNAQPPPAVEPRTSSGKDITGTSCRISTDSLGQRGSQKKMRRTSKSPNRLSDIPHGLTCSLSRPLPVAQLLPGSINSSSTTLLSNLGPVELSREESEASKPRWKGPPPLIAVREDMVRNRLSSFSPGVDPYTRQSPGQQSPTDVSPRYSSTFTIQEEEEDDMPLSHRRTMLHQQSTTPSPPPPTTPAPPLRWSHSGAPSRANSPAVLAAWRESVREDLKEKQNPLKLPVSHVVIGATGVDRSPSPFAQLQQRNASSASIGDKIAEGMQRGDMNDLHREAMRRMQAKANRKANGKV